MRKFSRNVVRRSALGLLAVIATVTTAEVGNSMLTRSIPPGGVQVLTIEVGANDDFVVVEGDGRGDADLDCWVYKNGRVVSKDVDDTDTCVMETPGMGTHQVRIKNWGSLTNYYTISQQ